ncbi:MAG: phosphotransferase [Candidatus Latescibacteria bacterium]|nr:phosphotransferase [Candidatus Latescibacterota bacterium]
MFIDLHSHILHGVDDGPESFEMSMEMIRAASESGIRAVVATPHILDSFQNEELIISRFRKLSKTIIEEKIPIDLFLGSEINFQFGIEDLILSAIGTFRGMGRYFLVETTLTHYPKHFEETLFSIIMNNRIPVFAHPERVGPIVGDTELISRLVDQGLRMQVNSGSLLGLFGGKVNTFAWELLGRGLVHFVASDAHNMRRRSFNLDAAWKEISERYDEDLADRLLFANPLKVLMGETLD